MKLMIGVSGTGTDGPLRFGSTCRLSYKRSRSTVSARDCTADFAPTPRGERIPYTPAYARYTVY
jgi:hypothetical protein